MISKTFIKADEIRTYYQPKICFPNQVIMLSIYIERGKKKKKKLTWIGTKIGECTSILGVKSYEIRIH